MTERRIGQIGLGALGLPFARRLKEAFGELRVYDLEPSRVRAAGRFAAIAARTPKDLAARCNVILLSLPGPDAVRAVMEGKTGVLAGAEPETLVIDTSSVDPWTSEAMHKAARASKVRYLDAPVSSGEPGFSGVKAAESGTFTFLVGGRKADCDAAAPVFELLGTRTEYLGSAGAGSVMKLVSNHISGITMLAAAEGLVLAAAAGVPVLKALDVMAGTVAASYVMQDSMHPRIEAGDYEPGFSTDLFHKDLSLAGKLGQGLNVPLLFNQLAVEIFQILRSQGRGGKGSIDCVRYMAELARVDLHDPPSRAQRERSVGRKKP